MKEKVIETPAFRTFVKSRICYTLVKPGVIVDLAAAQENTLVVKKLSGDNTLPILVDLRLINLITKEARDHFSMRERKAGVNAIAMVVSSPVSKIIGNFFLGLNKPVVPTQMFVSEAKAVRWLERYIHN
jgi:hypothetical protein